MSNLFNLKTMTKNTFHSKDFIKTKEVIRSCTNLLQLENTARKMVEFFKAKHPVPELGTKLEFVFHLQKELITSKN